MILTAKSCMAMWKGQHDTVPGAELAERGPPQVLMVARHDACLCILMYTVYFMFLHWEMVSLPSLMTP